MGFVQFRNSFRADQTVFIFQQKSEQASKTEFNKLAKETRIHFGKY